MIKNKLDLIEYLEADRVALGRKRSRPKFNDIIWRYQILLRKCEYYCNTKQNLFVKLISKIYLYRRFRLGLKCNYSIPLNTCGKGLCIAHIGPIIISNYARIGENCRIHVGVNIGADARESYSAPIIGNNVYIGPGAKLFGNIKIANNIAIGANSVVNKSFINNGVSVAGVPAKVINEKGTNNIFENEFKIK